MTDTTKHHGTIHAITLPHGVQPPPSASWVYVGTGPLPRPDDSEGLYGAHLDLTGWGTQCGGRYECYHYFLPEGHVFLSGRELDTQPTAKHLEYTGEQAPGTYHEDAHGPAIPGFVCVGQGSDRKCDRSHPYWMLASSGRLLDRAGGVLSSQWYYLPVGHPLLANPPLANPPLAKADHGREGLGSHVPADIKLDCAVATKHFLVGENWNVELGSLPEDISGPVVPGFVCVGMGMTRDGGRQLPVLHNPCPYWSPSWDRTVFVDNMSGSSVDWYYLPVRHPLLAKVDGVQEDVQGTTQDTTQPATQPILEALPIPPGVKYPPVPGWVYVGMGSGKLWDTGQDEGVLFGGWFSNGGWYEDCVGNSTNIHYWLPADSPLLRAAPPKPKRIVVDIGGGYEAVVKSDGIEVGCQKFHPSVLTTIEDAFDARKRTPINPACSIEPVVEKVGVFMHGDHMIDITREQLNELEGAYAKVS